MGLFSKSLSTQSAFKIPTRAALRRVLVPVLRSDQALNQFCLDYFPEVHENIELAAAKHADGECARRSDGPP